MREQVAVGENGLLYFIDEHRGTLMMTKVRWKESVKDNLLTTDLMDLLEECKSYQRNWILSELHERWVDESGTCDLLTLWDLAQNAPTPVWRWAMGEMLQRPLAQGNPQREPLPRG